MAVALLSPPKSPECRSYQAKSKTRWESFPSFQQIFDLIFLSVLNTKTLFRYILPFGLHFTPASLFPLQLCDPTELSLPHKKREDSCPEHCMLISHAPTPFRFFS